MRYFYLVYALVILIAAACNGSVKTAGEKINNTQDTPKTLAASLINIEEPADGAEFSSGEEIKMVLSLRGDKEPDSVRVFFDGKALITLHDSILEYSIDTESARLGKIPLKIMAYESGKRPQILTHFISLKSDIKPGIYSYRVVNDYPHDKTAYTQGLLYHNGYFYESTGQEGQSSVRKVEIETGEILKIHNLESKFFGEGLVIYDGRLFQLTWKNKVGFVYDLQTFEEIRRVHYTTQGWGLASNGEQLIMSDGTNKIYFLEPEYFTVVSSIEVYDNERPVWQLNELEYINGELWANIYMTDRIARIDPSNGKVLAYIDLKGILPDRYDHSELAELNGIAWDSENKRLFITGKNWPRLFEIDTVRLR